MPFGFHKEKHDAPVPVTRNPPDLCLVSPLTVQASLSPHYCLSALPSDVFDYMCSFLSGRALLSLGQSCKLASAATSNPAVWKVLALRYTNKNDDRLHRISPITMRYCQSTKNWKGYYQWMYESESGSTAHNTTGRTFEDYLVSMGEAERNLASAQRLLEKQRPHGFPNLQVGPATGLCKQICLLLAGAFRSNPSLEQYQKIIAICPLELLGEVEESVGDHASWRRASGKSAAEDYGDWHYRQNRFDRRRGY